MLEVKRPLRIALVGGGASGVEVALAMHYKLSQLAPRHPPAFELITAQPTVLSTHNAFVRRFFRRRLHRRGVAVRVNSAVAAIENGRMKFLDGRSASYDLVVWLTGAAPAPWLKRSGLATDERGFVAVNDYLQSTSHAEIFAAGDVARQIDHPRPKSGVYAVRQGPPLAMNLRRALSGEPLVPFIAQQRALALISAGERYAVASKGVLGLAGAWVWRWKDRIDRRFVERFNQLAAQSADDTTTMAKIPRSP